MAADAADYKKGARLRRGLCRRVVSPQGTRLTMICASLVLLQIMFAVHRFAQGAMALRAQILKRRPASFVISTAAKRSGEISPSDGTGGITAGDLSTQRIIGAVPACPHTGMRLRSR